MESTFSAVLWKEDITPAEAINCQKCDLCNQRRRIIWGEGNPKGRVMIILDNPGEREDKEGNEYVCGTRETLQLAVFNSGLSMDDLYVTYILKCRPIRRYNKEESRDICVKYLFKQIEIQKPEIIFCMGNTALQWFLGDKSAEVKNFRGEWHRIRGIITLATYHPLAIRRRPNMSKIFNQDWKLLLDRYQKDNDKD